MDMVCKSGLTILNMRVIGRMIKQMGLESLFTLMVMYMRVIGLMIKLKEKALIHIQMGLFIKGSGLMINNMVKEWRLGLMVQSMRVHIKMGRNMEEVS
jgi:hypothetical protein